MRWVVLALALLTAGCMNFESVERGGTLNANLGEQHYFTLKNLEGQNVSLETLLKNKKAVLINFFATWCPPCREEIPDLIELQEKYASSGFTVVGVDVEESANKVSSFVKKLGVNYPVLLDSDARVAAAYSIIGIPTTFLLDSAGNVLGEYHSFTSKLVADVEKALQ